MSYFIAPTEDEYIASKAWGMLTSLDLHGCNSSIIRDGDAIKSFTHELCRLLGVKRFGETVVVHFGADPRIQGYSMTQLIESSLVSGHFAEDSNSVYLDAFSCKFYDAKIIVDFSIKFFEGKNFNAHTILRGSDSQLPKAFLQKMAERNIILQG